MRYNTNQAEESLPFRLMQLQLTKHSEMVFCRQGNLVLNKFVCCESQDVRALEAQKNTAISSC